MSDTRAADSIDPATFEALAAALRPQPMDDGRAAALRARVLARVADPAPPGTRTERAALARWRQVGEGIRVRVLHADHAMGMHTLLIEMRSGAGIPGHPHLHDEECFVLQGEIEIGSHVLRAGDMHVASAGAEHGLIRCRRDALLMVRTDMTAPHAPAG